MPDLHFIDRDHLSFRQSSENITTSEWLVRLLKVLKSARLTQMPHATEESSLPLLIVLNE